MPPVWPFPGGQHRGVSLEPLYKTAPAAALRDPILYEMLALIDALREGRARERKLAEKELIERVPHPPHERSESFAVPIVMMGFPGIKSFHFKTAYSASTRIRTNFKKTRQMRRCGILSKQVVDAASRPSTNPKTIAVNAEAQFALGDHKSAELNLQKVLQAAPQLSQAAELSKRIELDHKLSTLAAQAEQPPADAVVKANLQQTLSDASRLQVASPVLLANIARANAVIGNKTEAVTLANKALKIDPNLDVVKT